ncbi:hypothetical protein [Candidatus Nanobsidianus stetteri]|uniref:Uncharacterized protein n=1 Tax=Nanobsidianus stetteri TaxID=1294122 RepID=A0A2T9WPJ0_NANST|nr:hypothetical protein [Candidatus Nanobsidianus stetteri]MCC5446884.1 hypothetical protein [Candidatus Nanobsidianus stetteri]PVU69745.1 hypothetical protein DDW05_03315 [Candidatus Nanobsidianus stetteri]
MDFPDSVDHTRRKAIKAILLLTLSSAFKLTGKLAGQIVGEVLSEYVGKSPRDLEEILFRNNDIQFIPLEVTDAKVYYAPYITLHNPFTEQKLQIEIPLIDNVAYLTVYNPSTEQKLQIALPSQSVSNRNINVGNLLSAIKSHNEKYGTNYRLYLVLGKENLSQVVQQNNGIWYLLNPQIYYKNGIWYLLDPRIRSNILISDRGWQDVYNALLNLLNGNATVVMPTLYQGPYSNSLWGWINGIGRVVTVYQSGQQVNSVENYINLADYILGTPNNPNPTSQGILNVDTIANVQQVGVYNSGGNQYPVYGVNDYYGTYIVLIPDQDKPLFSNL